jgi:hypothetical protein
MGPYRDDIVVTGGLVPLLYRFHDAYDEPRQAPLLTGDLDFTASNPLPVRGGRRLRDCLEDEGFVVIPARSSRHQVPAKHYFQSSERGTDTLASIHGEFLVPLVGSRTDRHGHPKSPQQLQDGLNAEALRFLDLLLWQPTTFDLRNIERLNVSSTLEIRMPRLAAYIIQKALCSERRTDSEKRDKDLAYIYDVATLSHGRWDELRADIQTLRDANSTWETWIADSKNILDDAFLSPSGDGPEAVARIYEDEPVTLNPEPIQRIISRFLRDIDL